MKQEIDEEQVLLAERYARALERIKEASETEGSWTEEDVETAETFLSTLKDIESALENQTWNEDEAKAADGYLDTLNSIEAFDQTWNENDVTEADKYLETLQAIEEKK